MSENFCKTLMSCENCIEVINTPDYDTYTKMTFINFLHNVCLSREQTSYQIIKNNLSLIETLIHQYLNKKQ